MGSIARAAVNKRDLILHDSLAFLSLIVVSFALFGVTLFLFQSFESHREELGKEWSARGRVALEQGRPEEAVADLRTALTYEPDVRADQLLLADALARAGHTDEATNYFLNLWDVRPGDGFINLQLARLAAKKGDYPEAVDYYRASTFGSWEGDGVGRRRAVRLELVDLLIGQKQFPQAKDELVTVSGNAPTGSPVNLLVARKFEQMGDTSDALVYDEKALASQALNPEALQQAASLAYSLGEYSQAERLLQRAVESKPKPKNEAELTELLEKSRRIRELNLSRDQDAEVRAEHILTASVIAQDRLKGCAGQSAGAGTAGTAAASPAAAALKALNDAWNVATAGGRVRRKSALENAETQDTWTALIYDTERQTAQVCGAPNGDDALLLQLANGTQGSATGGTE